MAMLAEKKRREKWCLNPRGKNWSDDKNKYGQRLLEKMGWSAGQGLGINSQGPTEIIHVKMKDNNKGLGYKENGEEWMKTTSDYNDLLDQLASANGIEADQTHVSTSLEDRSKKSKTRVHYHKFTRGKDLSRYSEKDLASIIGPDMVKTKADNDKHTDYKKNQINKGSSTEYFNGKKSSKLDDKNINEGGFNNDEDVSVNNIKGVKKKKKGTKTGQCNPEEILYDSEKNNKNENSSSSKSRTQNKNYDTSIDFMNEGNAEDVSNQNISGASEVCIKNKNNKQQSTQDQKFVGQETVLEWKSEKRKKSKKKKHNTNDGDDEINCRSKKRKLETQNNTEDLVTTHNESEHIVLNYDTTCTTQTSENKMNKSKSRKKRNDKRNEPEIDLIANNEELFVGMNEVKRKKTKKEKQCSESEGNVLKTEMTAVDNIENVVDNTVTTMKPSQITKSKKEDTNKHLTLFSSASCTSIVKVDKKIKRLTDHIKLLVTGKSLITEKNNCENTENLFKIKPKKCDKISSEKVVGDAPIEKSKKTKDSVKHRTDYLPQKIENSYTFCNGLRGKYLTGRSSLFVPRSRISFGQSAFRGQLRGRGGGVIKRGRISKNNFDAKMYAEKCKIMNKIPEVVFNGADLQIISGYAASDEGVSTTELSSKTKINCRQHIIFDE